MKKIIIEVKAEHSFCRNRGEGFSICTEALRFVTGDFVSGSYLLTLTTTNPRQKNVAKVSFDGLFFTLYRGGRVSHRMSSLSCQYHLLKRNDFPNIFYLRVEKIND